jgi:hypothetical protein
MPSNFVKTSSREIGEIRRRRLIMMIKRQHVVMADAP